MQFKHHRLENGLTIIAECNPNAYSTALGFFVNAGSRDEHEKIGGVSHFLEHMCFKGTPNRSAEDVNRELDEMGSFANARTGEERTIYHATVLPEFQDRAVELLADILRPSLREEDFETEKQVIVEEILMYEDQPPFGGHERIMAMFYGDHPLGQSVLGTVESVEGLTPQQMRDYFEQRYSPENILVSAAGNVDFDRLIKVADEACGHWSPFVAPRQIRSAAPNRGFAMLHRENAAQQYVLQLCPGPAAEHDERYASRLLATIFGDDSGSRLYWEMIDPGHAEYAGMGAYEYQASGLLMTMLCCAPEDAQANVDRLSQLQQNFVDDGISESELELAKRKITSHIVLQSERPENRMFSIGSNWLLRQKYQTVREIADAYRAVTRPQVIEIIERYPMSHNFTLGVGPLDSLKPTPVNVP